MKDLKKCVYYAHPMAHYDTELEWECIETIMYMLSPIGKEPTIKDGLTLMNPNQKWLANMYQNRKGDNKVYSFAVFTEIVLACDIVVGVTFLDGTLGAGVGQEMKVAIENDIPTYILFLDNGIKLFMPCLDIDNYKVLSIEETRKRIDIGEK